MQDGWWPRLPTSGRIEEVSLHTGEHLPRNRRELERRRISRETGYPVYQQAAGVYIRKVRPLVTAFPQRQERAVEKSPREKAQPDRAQDGQDHRGSASFILSEDSGTGGGPSAGSPGCSIWRGWA